MYLSGKNQHKQTPGFFELYMPMKSMHLGIIFSNIFCKTTLQY